jgi:hypothetical protein
MSDIVCRVGYAASECRCFVIVVVLYFSSRNIVFFFLLMVAQSRKKKPQPNDHTIFSHLVPILLLIFVVALF